MKNRFVALVALLVCLYSSTLTAQYINNGNFSTYNPNICLFSYTPTHPTDPSQTLEDYLTLVGTGWQKATAGTPDYFNTYYGTNCAGSKVNVPGTLPISLSNNFAGYQDDATPGTGGLGGYVGIHVDHHYRIETGVATQYREYITQQLARPLKAGTPYKISYKVSLADNFSTPTLPNNLKIGAYLSPTSVYIGNVYWDMLKDPVTQNYITPQISGEPVNPYSNLNNTTNWIPVEGFFVPQQDMHWITIGNFQPSVIKDAYPTGWIDYYFYIDDVEIQEAPGFCACYFDISSPTRISHTPCKFRFTINSLPGSCAVDQIVVRDVTTGYQAPPQLFPGGFTSGNSTIIDYTLPSNQSSSIVEFIFYTRDPGGNLVELCRRKSPLGTAPLACTTPCPVVSHGGNFSLTRIPGEECCWELKLTVGDLDITDISGLKLTVPNGNINDLTFTSSSSLWTVNLFQNHAQFANPGLNNNKLIHGQTYSIGKFCLQPGASKQISIKPLNSDGNEKDCPTFDQIISCPVNCCDVFDIQLGQPTQSHILYPCTSLIYIFNNLASSGCQAQKVTITVNGNTTVYTPPGGASAFSFGAGPIGPGVAPFTILTLGAASHTITVSVEVKDSQGNITVCTKTFTLDCTPNTPGGSKQGVEDSEESDAGNQHSCLEWPGNSTVRIAADCISGEINSIRVVDAMGRVVGVTHSFDATSNSFIVDLQTLSSGAYFIHVSSNEESATYPLLWAK